MAEKYKEPWTSEKAARIYRDINLLGAIAAEGAAVVVAPLAAPLHAWAIINIVQAAAAEVVLRNRKARRLKVAN